MLDADALQRLRSADKRSLASLIDQLGERSARAQGLGAVITTYDKLLATRGSQRLYIVADLSKRLALGMLKVGAKKLFIRTVSGAVKEIELSEAGCELLLQRAQSLQNLVRVQGCIDRDGLWREGVEIDQMSLLMVQGQNRANHHSAVHHAPLPCGEDIDAPESEARASTIGRQSIRSWSVRQGCTKAVAWKV